MNNKTLIMGAIIVILLGALLYWLVGGNQTPSNIQSSTQNITLPTSGSSGQQTTNPGTSSTVSTLMSVAIAGGSAIQTKNFINNPTTVPDPINAGYYYLGYHVYEGVPDPTATENPPYVITYFSATQDNPQYFNVALLREPIGTTREDAEQFLMADLGISQEQMCQLNYMVSVPDRINSFYAGKNLGFSFCPGAVKLPN